MKTIHFRSVLPGIFLFFFLIGTAAATDLLITVQDSREAVPVPQASIYMDGSNIGQTTSGGTFLLSHEMDADFTLRIIKNGYAEWNESVGPDLAFLQVSMTRLTEILTVQLYDADSLSPIANATVQLTFEHDSATGTSDEEGIVTFPATSGSTYTITISAPEYQTITTSVVIGESGSGAVQYWLVRNDRISFAVTDERRNPVEEATIYLDGERAGTTDNRGVLIRSVPRNVLYAIEVKKEGYQD